MNTPDHCCECNRAKEEGRCPDPECAVHDIWRRSPGHMRLAIDHWLAAAEDIDKAVMAGPGDGRLGHAVDIQILGGCVTLRPDGTFSISDTSGG